MATTPLGGTMHVHEPLTAHLFDVGIFKDTLLPTLGYSSAFAVLSYGIGRATDTVATKDILRPAYHVFNVWWSAVFRRVWYYGLPLSQVLKMQSRPEKLLLGGVTIWAGYRYASAQYQYIQRPASEKDDPIYAEEKKEEGFWNKALFSYFLPEAVIATLVALPFTAPYRHQGAVLTGYHPILQSTAVGLYAAGFALEVAADRQKRQGRASAQNSVWSVLSQPKNIASTAVVASFPLLLYSSDMLAPIELLGPLVYYLFHRYNDSKHTPQDDVEKAKATGKDVKDGNVDYNAEAEEVKNSFRKLIRNNGVLAIVAFGTVVGVLEGFTHGTALRFGE